MGRGQPPTAPYRVADDDSSRTVIAVVGVLAVVAALIRVGVFGFEGLPFVTASSYDKPVALTRFPLPEPSGTPTLLKDEEAIRAECARLRLPSDGVRRMVVAEYPRGGTNYTLAVLQFDAPEGARSCPNAFLSTDATALVLLGPADAAATSLKEALSRRASDEKTSRRKLEKLKTAGHASLAFTMDLLVGAFFFLLSLFLVKYFLILRRVE